jgi:hypothetical protein
MDPARGIGFDGPEQIRQADHRLQTDQEMHVVRHASDPQKGASFIPNDPGYIRIKIIPEPRMDESLSILGAEDEVIQELAERMGHDRLRGDSPSRARTIPRSPSIRRKNQLGSLNFLLDLINRHPRTIPCIAIENRRHNPEPGGRGDF